MKVEVVAFGPLKDVLGGLNRIEVDLPASSRLIDLLRKLGRRLGRNFSDRVFSMSGEALSLAPGVKVFVNGRDIDFLDGLDTRLGGGDVVYLIPPAGGG